MAAAVLGGALGITGCAQAPAHLDTTPPVSPSPSASTEPATPAADDTLLLRDPRIRESSGLATSAAHLGVLYTHNDRGHGAEVFAVSPDGSTEALLTLGDVRAVDWEDIAVTPDRRIWIGDIGDNDKNRKWISVYVAPEPQRLEDGPVDWTKYRLRYEDGPRNAEALMVHPESQRVYVVSKEAQSGGVYAAPRSLDTEKVNVLTKVADSPAGVTAADFSPDGTTLAMRTGRNAYAYSEIGGPPWALVLPPSVKGESLTFTADGAAILVGSEGEDSPVSRVRVPQSVRTGTEIEEAAQ